MILRGLFTLLLAGLPSVAWAVASLDSSNTATGTTAAISLSISTTAIGKMFVFASAGTGSTMVISDTSGLVFTLRGCTPTVSTTYWQCEWTADVPGAITDTVTITGSGSSTKNLTVASFKGVSGYTLASAAGLSTGNSTFCANPIQNAQLSSDNVLLYALKTSGTSTAQSSPWTTLRNANAELVQYQFLTPPLSIAMTPPSGGGTLYSMICDGLIGPLAAPTAVATTKALGETVINQPGSADAVGATKALGDSVMQGGSAGGVGATKALGDSVIQGGSAGGVGATKALGDAVAQGGSAGGVGATKVVGFAILVAVPSTAGGLLFQGFP